ncbi:MAG: helix-hairpin-helix domain-containing protein, partial [bacterium]|nr:helix-hairpin-helix domain-containing protein [bacterium]
AVKPEETEKTGGRDYAEGSFSLIDINSADADKLEELPGIGPVTALKIIRYREQNGAFSSIEDIQKVSGIGPRTFDAVKSFICVKTGEKDCRNGAMSKIDINTADMIELSSLPGIGEKTALNIISYRKDFGPFRSEQDILNVKGIGPEKLSKVKHLIVFDRAGYAPSGITDPSPAKININRAAAEEIAMLPGFSNNLAEKIIRYRKLNGPFSSAEKIADVPGISYMTFFKIQNFITIE